MKGWLRSWKLCEVSPLEIAGIAGWRKHRLKRAGFLIPPGNIALAMMDSGCRMIGKGWAEQEVELFTRSHPGYTPATVLDRSSVWLPHLPGVELREVPSHVSAHAAFSEMGRFHRLEGEPVHGDPHAGNLLYHTEEGSCRLIDFETTIPGGMPRAEGRARDFAILALDLWRLGCGDPGDLGSWRDAYGSDEDFCPVSNLFRHPSIPLRCYWRCLGYDLPGNL